MEGKGIPSMRLQMLITLACFATINAGESDISCLKSIKESLKDSSRTFSTWDFERSICDFAGVECWQGKNTVSSIELAEKGLKGPFPTGVKNCTSITSLILSNNYLSGPIPSNIGDVLKNIVHLDLSYNSLSGLIPPSIVNCKYINVLRLNNNRLTGQIPQDLTTLNRLKVFNVANNSLSGHVPTFASTSRYFCAECYENTGLCGGPLSECEDDDEHDNLFLSGFSVAFPLFTVLTMLFKFCYFP